MTRNILMLGAFAAVLACGVSLPAQAQETPEALAEAAGTTIADMKELYQRPTDPIPEPEDNKYTEPRYELGKMLFFEPRISRSQVTSCATCHNPSFSWSDSLSKGIGDRHNELGRRDPTILNLAWDDLLFWDGRASSLEEQALGPIASEVEMNLPHDQMVAKLKSIKGYGPYFTEAFPAENDPITKENVAKAIAMFERRVVSCRVMPRLINGSKAMKPPSVTLQNAGLSCSTPKATALCATRAGDLATAVFMISA